jgi:uncharacterized membrane protein
MKSYTTIALLILAAVFCITPTLGANKYLGGTPQISAYIAGTNEFSPGQDATITVFIQNSGTSAVVFSNQGTLTPVDIPTTAKFVIVGLSSKGTPINIKTDPQNLGDIPSPGITTASFTAKITSDATLGEYTLPLTIHYQYLSNSLANQPTSDEVQTVYSPVNLTIPLTVMIQPVVQTDVISAEVSGLAVGTEGYINLTIKNVGYDDGTQASVKILQHGDSAIIPTDDSVYVGDFPRGGVVSCQYKVSVSSDAQQQTYPIDVEVTYTNSDGNTVTSTIDTVGVPVAAKLSFAVVSPPAVITQGSDSVIDVVYQNTGAITANNAEARLTTYSPLASADSLAYLGDIPPGGKVTAHYAISAANGAAPGTYPLNTEVRYRDELDNSQVSDTFTAPVVVTEPSATGGLGQIPGVLTLLVLIVIGAGYYALVMRKKK